MAVDPIAQTKAAADAAQASFDQYKHNLGMNALVNTYGPTAYVPQEANNNQIVAQNSLINPLLVQNQQAQNTGLALTNQYNSAANGPRIEQLGIQNAAGQMANTQTAAVNDQAAAQQQAAQARQQLSAMLGTVGTAAQQPGANPAAIWDQAAPQVSQMLGVNPAQLGGYRDSFIKDPMGFITQTQQMLGATASAMMTPEQKVAATNANSLTDLRTAQGGLADAKATAAPITAQAAADAVTARAADSVAKAADKNAKVDDLLYGLRDQTRQADTQISTIGAILSPASIDANGNPVPGGAYASAKDMLDQFSGSPMDNELLSKLPGAVQAAYLAAVSPLGTDLALARIGQMRDTAGSLGGFRVTQYEFQKFSDSVANLSDLNQKPAQLRANLEAVKGQLQNIQSAFQEKRDDTVARLGTWTPPGRDALPGQAVAPQTQAAPSKASDPRTAAWQQENLTPISSQNGQSWQVNKAAAPAFQGFLADLSAEGYNPMSSGGFNYRTIAGSQRLSEHATGNAIDIGAQANPRNGSGATDLPADVGALAAKWGLEWGGTWKNPDPMHFEYVAGKAPSGSDAPYQNAAAQVPPRATPSPAANFAATDAAAQASQMQAPAPTVAQAPNRMDAFQQQQQAQGFQTPQLTPQQIGSPAFTIPGTNFTVGQAILWLRDQQKKGMDEQTAAAIAQKLGIARQ